MIDHSDELLSETAGRAGNVGGKMSVCLFAEAEQFTNDAYLTASKRAVEIGDTERVKFLMEQYQSHVAEPDPGYYGEVIRYAIGENRQMARTLLKQSPACWMEMASPDLLYCASLHPSENFNLMDELVKKGAPCGERAWEILNALTSSGNTWMAEILLRDGLKISKNDYSAFDVCVKNGAMECGKKLLEQGVGFERYTEWATKYPYSATDEKALAELGEYWQSLHPQEVTEAPSQGQTFGGLTQ